MACMKLGLEADGFKRQGLAWFCTTGLPSYITIEVGEMSFPLHKILLWVSLDQKSMKFLTFSGLEISRGSKLVLVQMINIGWFYNSRRSKWGTFQGDIRQVSRIGAANQFPRRSMHSKDRSFFLSIFSHLFGSGFDAMMNVAKPHNPCTMQLLTFGHPIFRTVECHRTLSHPGARVHLGWHTIIIAISIILSVSSTYANIVQGPSSSIHSLHDLR